MATARDAGSRDGGGSTDPISVVHVDDDSEFLSATDAFLTARAGDVEIETLTDPNAVLDRLETGSVDCVVSDYSMPEMDGLALLEAVRETWPEVPFVLYTGRGSEEVASDAIAAGVTEYVQKGSGTSHYDLLLRRVRNAVAAHRAQQRATELEHVAGVIREINQALLRADSHESLFADATETLAAAEPYTGAWIASVADGRLTTAASVGPTECRCFESDSSTVGALSREAIDTERLCIRQRINPDSIDDDAGFVPGEDYRSVAAVPLLADDDVVGVLVVFGHDAEAFDAAECALLEEVAGDIGFAVHAISLREQLEHRATELELLSRVLRHDIRNDIQIVLGWCALLAEGVAGDQRAYVEKIETTSRHIAELTDNAREIVEAIVADGDTPLEETDVVALLESEVEKAAEAFEAATFTLTDHTGGPTVLANEMLSSVFRNVLNNAVQHNEGDAPRVEVVLTETDDSVVVEVVDDGPGIPSERRETVFGKGERGFGSGGTGMGLYLVATLVDLYDGTVRIEDGDPGAAVVVELPTV
mgnify:CR=1 FL=1